MLAAGSTVCPTFLASHLSCIRILGTELSSPALLCSVTSNWHSVSRSCSIHYQFCLCPLPWTATCVASNVFLTYPVLGSIHFAIWHRKCDDVPSECDDKLTILIINVQEAYNQENSLSTPEAKYNLLQQIVVLMCICISCIWSISISVIFLLGHWAFLLRSESTPVMC